MTVEPKQEPKRFRNSSADLSDGDDLEFLHGREQFRLEQKYRTGMS